MGSLSCSEEREKNEAPLFLCDLNETAGHSSQELSNRINKTDPMRNQTHISLKKFK